MAANASPTGVLSTPCNMPTASPTSDKAQRTGRLAAEAGEHVGSHRAEAWGDKSGMPDQATRPPGI
jgi:hypothetical protein